MSAEVWQVTATLTIPNEEIEGFPKIVAGGVASKLQVDLEMMRARVIQNMGIEIEIGVSSCKTGELSEVGDR